VSASEPFRPVTLVNAISGATFTVSTKDGYERMQREQPTFRDPSTTKRKRK